MSLRNLLFLLGILRKLLSIFRTEETGLSTVLVPVYKTARRHIPGGNNFEEGRTYVLLPQQVAQHEFCDIRM